MKIVFVDIPLKTAGKPLCYAHTGNAAVPYKGEVLYPINAVLAQEMRRGEEAKAVMLTTRGGDGKGEENALAFQRELSAINESIGANIKYVTLATDFDESKVNHEARLRGLLQEMEEGAELYADITFGPKPLPMVMMVALNFAEKFLDADVKRIVYGKVEFALGKVKEGSQALYDITSLYYLNGLVDSMEARNADEAMKALDKFFAI